MHTHTVQYTHTHIHSTLVCAQVVGEKTTNLACFVAFKKLVAISLRLLLNFRSLLLLHTHTYTYAAIPLLQADTHTQALKSLKILKIFRHFHGQALISKFSTVHLA